MNAGNVEGPYGGSLSSYDPSPSSEDEVLHDSVAVMPQVASLSSRTSRQDSEATDLSTLVFAL